MQTSRSKDQDKRRKKKRLTGAGMVKPENRFLVRERLLEVTAAASRSGLMATHTTPWY